MGGSLRNEKLNYGEGIIWANDSNRHFWYSDGNPEKIEQLRNHLRTEGYDTQIICYEHDAIIDTGDKIEKTKCVFYTPADASFIPGYSKSLP